MYLSLKRAINNEKGEYKTFYKFLYKIKIKLPSQSRSRANFAWSPMNGDKYELKSSIVTGGIQNNQDAILIFTMSAMRDNSNYMDIQLR